MKRIMLVLLAGLLVGTSALEAQRRTGDRPSREERRERLMALRGAPVPEFGVRGLYDFDERDFGIGAHAQIPLGYLLRFVPSGEVYFGDETTWQANADVAASLLLLRAGAGLALVDGSRVDPDEGGTEFGLNLFVGLQSPRWRGARVRPFAEARWTFLDDITPFRGAAGLNIPIGRRTAN